MPAIARSTVKATTAVKAPARAVPQPTLHEPAPAAKPKAAVPVAAQSKAAASAKAKAAAAAADAAKAAKAAKAKALAAPPASAAVPKAPAASLAAGSMDVVVDIKASDSGYENQIYWSSDNFVTRHYLGVDNHTASINLGRFAAGTKIDFGIVNGNGQFFRTGGAGANADGLEHTRTSAVDGGQQIGFEDLYGGGDKDFNDAILQVRSVAVAPQPNTTTAAGGKDNRSGLGDGTNPGQGAGRDNSPNMGTLNPSNSGAAQNLYAAIGLMA